MTHVPAEIGAADANSADPSGHPAGSHEADVSYLALLRLPGAARFCISGVIGRAPMAMFGLGTVLLVAARSGRYGLAGLVAGAGSVGYALAAPPIARLADRLGQRRVLRPLVTLFFLSCLAFVGAAQMRAPAWLLIITGTVAGASMPTLGAMVRARWSALLGASPALQSAFALESVLDELVFVIGPALVTLLAAAAPPAGVLVAMAAAVVGTLVFAAQRRTEPAVHPWHPQSRRTGGWLPAAGLVTMAPVYLLLGAMFSSIDLSTVDFAQRHGHRPLAGLILGTYALGSGIGGLWYGSRQWRAPLERRFARALALTVAGVSTFWAQPGLVSLDIGLLFSGLAISPTMIAGYALIERQASWTRRTEAMTWLSSTLSVGVALGSAASGRIVDTLGPRWGYGFAAACGVIAVAICLLGLARLRAIPVAEPAQCIDA